MELDYILIINLFCIIMGIIGIWKIPLVALMGLVLSLTVILEEIVLVGIADSGILTLSIATIVICAVCTIWGYGRNA